VAGCGKDNTLGPLLRNILNQHPAFSPNPLGDWRELAGEQVARHCQPKSLKNKVLRVVVQDSNWKHHLHLNLESLLANINRGRQEPLVEKIVLVVGEVPEADPPLNPNAKLLEKMKAKPRRGKKLKAPLRILTAEEQQLLQRITDPELRRLCARLLRRVADDSEPDADSILST
jgi:hypothetical protein